MIEIVLSSQGEEHRLTMTGHADYCPGNDIVCAGASAIAYALLGYLHNAGEHLGEMVEERVLPGDLRVDCLGDEMVGECYKMALIGFLQLEAAYPDYVDVAHDCEWL